MFSGLKTRGNPTQSLSAASKPGEKLEPVLSEAEQKEEGERREMHNHIFLLWEEVWLGLYQLHDRQGPYHVDRLRLHYAAAGMSSYLVRQTETQKTDKSMTTTSGVLGLLGYALSRQGPRGLRLYEGLSFSSLEAVIEILQAYRKEIAGLEVVYCVLKGLQVSFRAPTESDEGAVLERYPPVSDALGRRLLHLDARLKVLESELEDETWDKRPAHSGVHGWYVEHKVFPSHYHQESSKFGSGIGSMSFAGN